MKGEVGIIYINTKVLGEITVVESCSYLFKVSIWARPVTTISVSAEFRSRKCFDIQLFTADKPVFLQAYHQRNSGNYFHECVKICQERNRGPRKGPLGTHQVY